MQETQKRYNRGYPQSRARGFCEHQHSRAEMSQNVGVAAGIQYAHTRDHGAGTEISVLPQRPSSVGGGGVEPLWLPSCEMPTQSTTKS